MGAEFVRGRVCQGPSLLGAEMSRNPFLHTKLSYLIVSASWYLSFYASGEQVLIDCCTYRGKYLLKQRSKPQLICRSLEGTTPLGPYNATRGFTL